MTEKPLLFELLPSRPHYFQNVKVREMKTKDIERE